MNKTINHYNQKASDFFNQYESQSAEEIHSSWSSHINTSEGLAFDIGAGSGRDALWLAKCGYTVYAVEPSEKLRTLAKAKNYHLWLANCYFRQPMDYFKHLLRPEIRIRQPQAWNAQVCLTSS